MSEPKLISPMLDDFIMGGVISEHDGVRCCPAMRKNSDDKYIVKIISVPASQTKLEALLLTGAYSDKASALVYFKELADGIVGEKDILDRMSQLEGFVAYEDCQIVPMEDGTGFEVYLLGKYRNSLERHLARNPMTHLGAVNLGLDLCAGLAICRRSGYMYIDVKPSNIFLTGDKEYCIGDLGFVRLHSLKYESLPDKYRSVYTAPEVEDAFASLSNTMDIYAVGVVLYQVFNGGTLPFSKAPNGHLDPPAYADSEMAEIILKACDPDPAQRWQDPVQMGQAIVNYMQKNGVNDTPIVTISQEDTNAEESMLSEESNNTADVADALDSGAEIAQTNDDLIGTAEEVVETDTTQATELVEVNTTEDGISEDTTEEATEETIEIVTEAESDNDLSEELGITEEEDLTVDAPSEETTVVENESVEDATTVTEPESKTEDTEIENTVTEEFDNLSFLDDLPEYVDADYDDVSEDVMDILDQVDELAALQVPDPVVAPEPVEIKLPDPIVEEPSKVAESAESADEKLDNHESESDVSDESAEEESTEAEEETNEEMPYVPKKKRTGLIWCIVLLILIGLAAGGYFYYQNYYLQPIYSLEMTGAEDRLEVTLTSDLDESLLTVVCADPHGNRFPAPVVNSTAVFSGLAPDTAYAVSVEVEGFHKLTGTTSKVYSTPVQTKIAQMSVITGSESGSVILSFAVEGPDSDQWNVIYNADGEAERVTAFPAHMVTLTGLTVGKEYTFRLEPVTSVYLNGESEIKYVVKDLICAENLQVTSCADGNLTAQWSAPANAAVAQWKVRCYSDAGYDNTITTAETTATFEGVDDSNAFTVEVTAAEMSVSKRVQVSANSVTINNFTVSEKDATLKLKWKASRSIPEDGWKIRYSINGVSAPDAITAKENSVSIAKLPGTYVFTFADSSGNTALGGPFTYVQGQAANFSDYSVKKDNITVRLCKTPASSSWSYKDIQDEDYVNSFSLGQKVSMVVSLSKDTKTSSDKVIISYAIYNELGELVSFSHDEQTWQSMWYKNHCELDIPSVPSEVGTYNVVLLFNGAEAGSQKFAITN